MNVLVSSLRDANFDSRFVKSLMKTGFAVVTNHGLDHGLIKETQAAWKEFFKNPKGYKALFVNQNDPNLGYTAFGGEKAVGAEKADLKEFFHWKPGSGLPIETSTLTQKVYGILEGDIAGRLLYALKDLGSHMDYSGVCRNSNNTLLRTLYYPALEACDAQEGAVRAAAHEDINFITLLVAASAPGLQVQDSKGNWLDVPHEENSIVVNIGDCLQLASGGTLKSTTHRVINPDNSASDRLSMPLFIHPHGDTLLAPGVTAQQFLNERLNTIYQTGYKK